MSVPGQPKMGFESLRTLFDPLGSASTSHRSEATPLRGLAPAGPGRSAGQRNGTSGDSDADIEDGADDDDDEESQQHSVALDIAAQDTEATQEVCFIQTLYPGAGSDAMPVFGSTTRFFTTGEPQVTMVSPTIAANAAARGFLIRLFCPVR